MGTNVGELSFLLKSTYDNGGVKAAMADNKAMMKSIDDATNKMKSQLGASIPDNLVESFKARETAEMQASRTAEILTRARLLGTELESKAIIQKYQRAQQEESVLAAMEKTRSEKAINRVLAPDSNKNQFLGLSRGAIGGLQNAGFMIQDFSSQFSNAKTTAEGLSRGIGAITNNVQMLGAAFGPTGMAVSAIGGGIAGVVLPAMIRWVSHTSELEAATKAVETTYEGLRATMSGMESASRLGLGIVHAKDAKKQIDDLKGQLSSLSIEKGLVDQKLAEATKGLFEGSKEERKQAEADLTVWTKRGGEIAKAYGEVQDKLKVINGLWGPSRLDAGLKADAAKLKADEDAKRRKLLEDSAFDKAADSHFKQLAERDKAEADIRGKFEDSQNKTNVEKFDASMKAEREKMLELRVSPETLKRFDIMSEREREQASLKDQIQANDNKLELLQDKDTKPNGMSSGSIRGTAGAASAINRAIAGTNSEERSNQQIITELRKQNQLLEKAVKQLNFKRAELKA